MKGGAPEYVAWWVDEDHQVSWREGKERVDHLHTHGPTAFAFDFKSPFDAEGNPCMLDRETTKAKAQVNAAG